MRQAQALDDEMGLPGRYGSAAGVGESACVADGDTAAVRRLCW